MASRTSGRFHAKFASGRSSPSNLASTATKGSRNSGSLIFCVSECLPSKHGIVAGGAHEEKHYYRQEGVGPAGQEGLAGHGFGFVGDGRAVGGVVAGPLNETLLDAPDYPPHVEQHHPAHTAADA